MCFLENTTVFVNLLQLLLKSQNRTILLRTTAILPTVFCILSSPYTKLLVLSCTRNTLDLNIICEECVSEKLEIVTKNKSDKLRAILTSTNAGNIAVFDIYQRLCSNDAVVNALFENYKLLFETNDAAVKVCLLETLLSVSKHVKAFYSVSFMKLWMIGDYEENAVRSVFSSVIGTVLKHVQVQ